MVLIEQLEGGAFLVSRVFPNGSSAQAGAIALERIVPEGYQPGSPTPSALCGIDHRPLNLPATDTGD